MSWETLIEGMALGAPADRSRIESIQETLGVRFPNDYVAFLLAHNGGEGPIGEKGYAQLLGTEALETTNAEYGEFDQFRGRVIFGSNMGGEAFVFEPSGETALVPWVGGADDAVPQGSFTQLLGRVASGTELD